MKKSVIYALSLIASIGFAAPLFAGPVGVQRLNPYQERALLDALQTRKDQLAQQADLENARGPLRIAYMSKQEEIDAVMNQLASGEVVPGYEINDALEPVTD